LIISKKIEFLICIHRHQLHKEIAKLNKINAALETQRQHTVLLQAESSLQVVANQARALAKSEGEVNQELEYESTLQVLNIY
jgi:hypothetical protein